MKTPNILYEDNHLLVVEKPVNVPVQADSSGDEDLLCALKAYIKQKYDKPGEVYLGLVHRLDRPVGGVMVFARTSKAAARLSSQFGGRGADKRYFAIVEGRAPTGDLRDFILRDETTGTSRAVPEGTPDAKPASLSSTVISGAGGKTLLSIDLHTGRHHQIRVQLAQRGAPIYGDQRYNPSAVSGQQIALWAYSLCFEHPTLHTRMTFRSLPKGGAWEAFSAVLPAAALGVGIAYCDRAVLIADKPAGLETAKADGGEDTLESRLSMAYGPVFPAHRLDAGTKGLVIFARNEAALAELETLIKERRIRKFYRCTVLGRPTPAEAVLTAYCEKDAERGFLRVFDSPAPGRKEMVTGYRVLQSGGETSLLEIELFTGRTHQIRAHMAHIGHPLTGDDKYGDRAFNKAAKCRAVDLTAVRLVFPEIEKQSPLAALSGLTIERNLNGTN